MARRKNGHKPEPRKERPRIFLCAEHKRRLEELYYLDETNSEGTGKDPSTSLRSDQDDRGGGRAMLGPTAKDDRWGVCFGCMRETWGREYAFEPRRVRYSRSRSGGGEREKAGRGA